MENLGSMLHRIFYAFGTVSIPAMILAHRNVFSLILIALVIHWLPSRLKESWRGAFILTPVYAKVAVAALTVFVIYQFKSAGILPFIYFQF